MPWRRVVTVMLDPEGGYLDADEGALELLGVETVDDLRTMPPGAFAVLPPDPDEQEAMRRAYAAIQAEGVLAELAFQRTDGECVRVRTAILDQGERRFAALFYPIERPTTNFTPRVFGIADILAEWRSAERRMMDLDPDSEQGRGVAADIELLRQQHRALFRVTLERQSSYQDTP